eukprot:318365-Chlamydomonas_euryale.AAC.6
MFSVTWPATWAAKGYTTFTMGCEGLEDARSWHAAMLQSIEGLRGQRRPARKAAQQVERTASASAADVVRWQEDAWVAGLWTMPGLVPGPCHTLFGPCHAWCSA